MSTTLMSTSLPSTPPRSRPVSMASASSSRRTRSFRLPKKPVEAPIPPTLASSKYLTSPHSIFRRAISDPHLPSQEDEEWLRDTVPMAQGGIDVQGETSSRITGLVVVVRRTEDGDGALRGRNKERTHTLRTATASSMSSPPLVRNRPLPKATVSSRATNWLQQRTAPTRSNTTGSWPSLRHD